MSETQTEEYPSIPEALTFKKYLPDPKVTDRESLDSKSSAESKNIGLSTPPRDKRGLFLPGHRYSPGKLLGRYDFFPVLVRCLQKVEKEKGISLIEHAVERAYKNDAVMIAILKKVLPDLTTDTGLKGPQIVQIMLTHRADLASYSAAAPSVNPESAASLPVVDGEVSQGTPS